MPRRLRFAAWFALVLAVAPAFAFAQPAQLRLSWDHCAAEGYVGDRSFACNTNTGIDRLFATLVINDGIPRTNVANLQAWVDFKFVSPGLPNWWRTFASDCRANALGLQTENLPSSANCEAWYLGSAAGQVLGLANIRQVPEGPNTLRLEMVAAVPAGSPATLPADREILCFTISTNHVKSTGTGSCAGCDVPACIGLGELDIYFEGGTRERVIGSTASTATWQGAYVSSYVVIPPHQEGPGFVGYHGYLGCTLPPVPAHGRTWGTIKSFYR